MFRGGGADIMRHLLLVIVIIFDNYPPQPPFLAQAISSTLSLLAPLLPSTVQLTLYRRTPTYVPGRDVTFRLLIDARLVGRIIIAADDDSCCG